MKDFELEVMEDPVDYGHTDSHKRNDEKLPTGVDWALGWLSYIIKNRRYVWDNPNDLTLAKASLAVALEERKKEPDITVDELLTKLDLDPHKYRTDGGQINIGKLKSHLLYPQDSLPADHWMNNAKKPWERPTIQNRIEYVRNLICKDSETAYQFLLTHDLIDIEGNLKINRNDYE